MLQNLANKPSYAKEAYMMSLNPFVDNNKTRMNLFLNSLCDVGDFYDTLEVRRVVVVVWDGVVLTRTSRSPQPDGSVHGALQERPPDQHHHE
jgi:hypothetical protein